MILSANIIKWARLCVSVVHSEFGSGSKDWHSNRPESPCSTCHSFNKKGLCMTNSEMIADRRH